MALFAYGTLMDAEIMHRVSGLHLEGTPATLRGFRRRRIYGEVYPGIVPAPHDWVDGLLYRGICAPSWERLDRFEGDLYERWDIEVELERGRTRKAQTYVVRPEFSSRLSDSPWSLDRFLGCDRAAFEEEYRGFRP